ncbi:hypothetical protein P4S64_24785 [Vibrio sp. M60_M31a]
MTVNLAPADLPRRGRTL